MKPEAQQWRDHLACCEREQLQRVPLHPPQSPLEQAHYQVALEYLKEELPPQDFYLSQSFAFRADDATRCAFYDFFGPDPRRPFCMRSLQWKNVFSGQFVHKSGSPISVCWHYFKPYQEGNFDWNTPHPDAIIEDYSPHELFIRAKGALYSPLSAHGWTDYWHWDGTTLSHLPHWDWSWIS